jgi:hypothetical protein
MDQAHPCHVLLEVDVVGFWQVIQGEKLNGRQHELMTCTTWLVGLDLVFFLIQQFLLIIISITTWLGATIHETRPLALPWRQETQTIPLVSQFCKRLVNQIVEVLDLFQHGDDLHPDASQVGYLLAVNTC